MIWVLYYAVIYLMVAGIYLSSFWNNKSKLWIQGRRHWLQRLPKDVTSPGCRVWIHVASLGEFEQARPVIEKLKNTHPQIEIILTFFSPSGYSIRSKYHYADVHYLPADLPGHAQKWIDRIQPDMAVFVKYDLWPGYLKALQKQNIPTLLISAHWIPGKWFSSWSIPPVKNLLKKLNMIFLQKSDHLQYFKDKGFANIKVAGDTRIDRSLELPKEALDRIPSILRQFASFDLVAGSTWPADEKILSEVIERMKLRVILAPHDVSEENLRRLEQTFSIKMARLSNLDSQKELPQVILVDQIGLLSALYSLGEVAYVGGGFGSGIHNILEPLAHQKPVIFGPKFTSFPEAVEMVNQKGAWTIQNSAQLIDVLTHLKHPGESDKAGEVARKYLEKNKGASELVVKYILESIPCAL